MSSGLCRSAGCEEVYERNVFLAEAIDSTLASLLRKIVIWVQFQFTCYCVRMSYRIIWGGGVAAVTNMKKKREGK